MICFSFWDRLVADNIDHEILVRVQTKTHTNRSIHWTHQFAVLDRVQEPGLEDTKSQKSVKHLQFRELLPDCNVQKNLITRWAVLVSRIVTKYLKPFNFLKKRVVWHIPHPYSKEMAQRSTLVSVLVMNAHPPKKRMNPLSFQFILMPRTKMFVFFLQCCQGMEFLNPNVSGDMAQLLQHSQEKYVPITVN